MACFLERAENSTRHLSAAEPQENVAWGITVIANLGIACGDFHLDEPAPLVREDSFPKVMAVTAHDPHRGLVAGQGFNDHLAQRSFLGSVEKCRMVRDDEDFLIARDLRGFGLKPCLLRWIESTGMAAVEEENGDSSFVESLIGRDSKWQRRRCSASDRG